MNINKTMGSEQTIVVIKDKQYILDEITIGMSENLLKKLRRIHVAEYLETCKETNTPPSKLLEIQRIDAESLSTIYPLESVCITFFEMSRKNHPELTMDDIKNFNVQDIMQIMEVIKTEVGKDKVDTTSVANEEEKKT